MGYWVGAPSCWAWGSYTLSFRLGSGPLGEGFGVRAAKDPANQCLEEVGKARPVVLVRLGKQARLSVVCACCCPALAWQGTGQGWLSSEGSKGVLGTPLTSAIWISSGSSRGWLGPLAKLRFWWAGHMFCRR